MIENTELVAIIRKAMSSENSAVSEYLEDAEKLEIDFPEVAEILKHIADEELVHIGELTAVLAQYETNDDTEENIQDGESEATAEMLDTSEEGGGLASLGAAPNVSLGLIEPEGKKSSREVRRLKRALGIK
jgi:rubrerythrin